MSAETGDRITRKYGSFRGVDFRGDECGYSRSPDSLNVWRNYKKLSSIETRPGLENLLTEPTGVRAMLWHKDKLYYVSNSGYLHALCKDGTVEYELCFLGSDAFLFEFNGKLYAKGSTYYVNVTDGKPVDPYIPTTTIGRKPAGGGTIHEDVNLLSPYRINTFLADGKSNQFFLDAKELDTDYTPVVKINDTPVATKRYKVDYDKGMIDFRPYDYTASVTSENISSASNWTDDLSKLGAETYTLEWTIETAKVNWNTNVTGILYVICGDEEDELFRESIQLNTVVGKRTTFTKKFKWLGNSSTFEIHYEGSDGASALVSLDLKVHKSYHTLPPVPKTDGQDNGSVQFKKTNAAGKNKIMQCTIAQEFDNRVFFSGNPNYPSTIWHSSLQDPSYFSDLDYYVDGVDQAPIRSMVAGNNGLWVFRDESESNSSVFYHTPALDADYGKIYPSSHSSISLGCVGRAINFNDDIVFFSQRGMESASTDVTTEQFVTHRSSLVDRKLLTNPFYKDMILAEWEGYLLVFVGSDVYLADSRAVLTNENHMEYEWYHWNLGKYAVTCATVHDGVLYIGTDGDEVNDIPEGHIYTLTGEAKNGDAHYGYSPNGTKWEERMHINSYWTTPKDRFGTPNKLKTTNKKGCVVEALGDVAVYAKTDDDEAYELIGTNEGVEDHIVCRIKKKKWKDIQLKFQSHTSFCLEAASLECFVGGYIKR